MGNNELEWSLDMVEVKTLLAKKIKLLSALPTLHGVLVRELGRYYPSNPPEKCIILLALAL